MGNVEWNKLSAKEKSLRNAKFSLTQYEEAVKILDKASLTVARIAMERVAKEQKDWIEKIESGTIDHIFEKTRSEAQ